MENYYSDFQVASNIRNKLKSHVQDNKGEQLEMKNTTCSTPSFYSDQNLNDFSFYAIFNNPSSDIVSKYLAKEQLNIIVNADPLLFDDLANNPPVLGNRQNEANFIEKMKKAITQSFLNIESNMRDSFEIKKLKELEYAYRNESLNGTTALTCLITQTHIIIANCSESKAILVKNNEITLITNNPTEREASPIQARVQSISMPEPDIYVQKRSDRDEFLVLATKSVWDLMSNQEMIELIQSYRNMPNYTLNLITNKIMCRCAANVRNFFLD